MSSAIAPSTPDLLTYRSGVAARLAGIPVETLRVWERRYSVIGPRLSPRGQKLYSQEEIRRLALIKQLVDAGHAIGGIAALTTDALITMRATSNMPSIASGGSEQGGPHAVRVALVGPVLSSQWRTGTAVGSALQVVGLCADADDAQSTLDGVHADVVAIELPSLDDTSLAVIERVKRACGARLAIVLYRFSPSAIIRRIRDAGHEVARAPSGPIEIEALCYALLRPLEIRARVEPRQGGVGEPPPPRFDARALAALAQASTTVYCECPRHLVELVLSLGSFEQYSADCANRGPEDAALHRDLQRTAGHARALMEESLLRVAIAEGLPVSKGV